MAREVTHESKRPERLDEDDLGDDGAIFVCRCGLSGEKPLCDGSHKAAADEEEGTLYKYESGGEESRREIGEIVYVDD